MEKDGSADIVGEARSDLAWQHVIALARRKQNVAGLVSLLTSFARDNSGVVVSGGA